MPKKKGEKQHIVPQFYLKNFTNEEGLLFCYSKEKKRIHPCHTGDIWRKKDHYEVAWRNTLTDSTQYILPGAIEKHFGKQENDYALCIRELLKKCKSNMNNRGLICSSQEHCVLSQMIVNFIVRNPASINEEYYDQVNQGIMEDKNAQELERSLKALGMESVAPIISFLQKSALYGMRKDDNTFVSLLADIMRLNYTFYISDCSLVTADMPVIYKITGERIFSAYISLSSHVAVIFDPHHREYRNRCFYIKKELADQLNNQYLNFGLTRDIITDNQTTLEEMASRC